jgi:hypothetical protein
MRFVRFGTASNSWQLAESDRQDEQTGNSHRSRLGARPWFRVGSLVPLRAAAEAKGNADFSQLWAGQAAALGRELPAAANRTVLHPGPAELPPEARGPNKVPTKPNNPAYLEWALKLSRPGTVVIGDNVVRDGAVVDATSSDASIRGVRAFISMLAADVLCQFSNRWRVSKTEIAEPLCASRDLGNGT